MLPRRTVLSLAIAACLVLGAGTSSRAAAQEFHTWSAPAYLKGSQATENVFTFAGGTAKCTGAEFKGSTFSNTSSAISLAPSYSGCKAMGQNASISANGCELKLPAPLSSPPFEVQVGISVLCPKEKQIVIKLNTAGCEINIPEQSPLDFADHANQEFSTQILTTWTVDSLSYTSTGGICGSSGSSGKYSGSVTIKAYSDLGHTTQTALWVK